MRVIAGSARSLPLKTVRGSNTRPTTDRIKETLFNIIAPEIPGCRFLDLFSGSGGIGIEALSRGAEQAVFVEQDRAALQVIRQNLQFTKLSDRAVVTGMEAVRAVTSMNGQKPFDIIFMDPPYGQGHERRILEALRDNTIADGDTLILIEALVDTDFSYLEELGFMMKRDKRYGTNRHVFVRRSTFGQNSSISGKL
jgi:16S rRNA (guanine966-N2)-methyltransferase